MKKFYFLFFLLFTFTNVFSQLEGTTWRVAPTAQALAVGPSQGDFSWWSNTADDVAARACFFDDQFVFEADGTFRNVQDGETWLEAWQGIAADGCGTSVAPHDGSNSATWTFDAAASTITLTGVGAHLGLPKVTNNGELTNPADAPASITYPVIFEGNTMTVDINFGGGFWHFVFENVGEAGGEPTEPTEPTSSIEGAWQIAPIAQALAVGPTQGDFSWWSNTADDVAARACFFDDQFVFEADGTFRNVQDGETWLEAWQGVAADGCGTPIAPHDGSNPATWTFDEAAGTITLTGVGAHLGLPKVTNSGELTNPADAPASVTYPVAIEGNTMTIDIDFGGGFWHFVLQKEGTTGPPPTTPTEVSNVTFSVDMNGFPVAFTTVFVSGEFNAWSGEANPLSDADGDGIWTGEIPVSDGTHEYKFTLDNWTVQEQFAVDAPCTITDPTGAFTNRIVEVAGDAAVCFQWNTCESCEGVVTGSGEPATIAGTWQVAPIAQALAVGPSKGDFSWWSNTAEDVTVRACFFDDQFVFNEDGTFNNIQDGETWLETWQGVAADGCGAPIAPHDGSNPATWTVDEAAGTITLTGVGAHLGLPKVTNNGELANPADAPASITYPIVIEGNTMTIDIDFGGGVWHFVLQKEGTAPPPPPTMPTDVSNVTFSVDMNGYTGTFSTVFISGSFNAWSGDANPLSDANGDGIWTGEIPVPDGTHEYKFTVDSWADQEQFTANAPCTLTDPTGEFTNRLIEVAGDATVCFKWNTCDACGEAGTGGGDPPTGGTATIAGTWQVAPIAQALAVGPSKGDFSWWSNTAGDVAARACFFDDQFIFEADGTFRNVQDGETWLETWQGVAADGCGASIAPHDGSNPATWTFDEAAGTITLMGVGAHLGIPKVTNNGELTNPADAPASVTYPVTIEGNTMTVDIDFGGGVWHFVFEQTATTTTSIHTEIVAEDLFSFSPNPANAQIQILSDEVIDELTIHDITGKILITKVQPASSETINVSGLTSGLYIIQARVGNKISVEKLSIK